MPTESYLTAPDSQAGGPVVRHRLGNYFDAAGQKIFLGGGSWPSALGGSFRRWENSPNTPTLESLARELLNTPHHITRCSGSSFRPPPLAQRPWRLKIVILPHILGTLPGAGQTWRKKNFFFAISIWGAAPSACFPQ